MSGDRVLILGGGYASINAYKTLRRTAWRAQVTVVSEDDCHNFHGFTGEVVAGIMPYTISRAPLSEIYRPGDFVHGRVEHVDLDAGRATVSTAQGGLELEFDHLLVATGGLEPIQSVPGVAEHGYTLRKVGEFPRMLERLREVLERGAPGAIVVVGGGLAGVEIAAAAADRVAAAGLAARVVLAHSGPQLLPAFQKELPKLIRVTDRELAKLGVEVMTGARLKEVTATQARFEDGRTVEAALVLATIGQRAVRVDGLDALPRDEAGRLVTGPSLSVRPGVWSAGDAARVAHPASGEPVPANAIWAIKAGEHVGRSIGRTIRGRQPRPFGFRGLGQAASFGVGRSVAELYGMPITGPVGWVLRIGFFLAFMPHPGRAARTFGSLVALPFVGRYPIVITQRPGRPVPQRAGAPPPVG